MVLYSLFTLYVISPLNTMTGKNYLGGVYVLWVMIGLPILFLSSMWLYYFVKNKDLLGGWISGGTFVLTIVVVVWLLFVRK